LEQRRVDAGPSLPGTAGDCAGVRDADALDKLPEAERAEWRKLWADVDAVVQKAAPEK
jgi:hypothetical protein